MISHNFNLHGGNLPILSQLPILHSSLQSSCKLRILHSSNHLANFQSILHFWLRKLLKTSNPTLFQSSRNLTKTSYENFSNLPILHFWLRNLTKTSDENFQSSRNLTETSQNFQTSTLFQSSTFGYAILRKLLTKTSQNFLRKLLKTSNPPLLVMKTSYQNFSKLPILHFSLRKLPIPPVFVTKTSDSSTFGYENSSRKLLIPRLWLQNHSNFSKLFTKTSQNFQSYTLPILHFWLRKPETSSSSNLKT